jgi:Flp pilus assembly protein TadD
MDRIEQLRGFLASQPDQPFPRYALALELKGKGDVAAAVSELQDLLRRAPDYLAAYLQLGMILQSLGRDADARQTLVAGQEVARKKGDTHALSELTSALEALG